MRCLIQRVTRGNVTIDGVETARIGHGMVVLLGVMRSDTPEAASYLAQRAAALRIFDDADGVPNINISDCNGEALVVSQFTLCADTKKGNRPSYINAAPPEIAVSLYNAFVERLRELIGAEKIQTGVFRAMMQIELVNDGPHTILLESE